MQDVPDLWVTQDLIQAWQDDTSKYHDDKVIEWYKGYKKCKAQKAKIKEELMPAAWHPD